MSKESEKGAVRLLSAIGLLALAYGVYRASKTDQPTDKHRTFLPLDITGDRVTSADSLPPLTDAESPTTQGWSGPVRSWWRRDEHQMPLRHLRRQRWR